MHWLLVILIYGSLDGGAAIQTIPVKNLATCQEAAKLVLESFRAYPEENQGSYGRRHIVHVACIRDDMSVGP